MRILFVWSFYTEYLKSFYQRFPDLASASYDEQYAAHLNDFFGSPGSHVSTIRKLGHEAQLLIYNCEFLQKQWAIENDVVVNDSDWKYKIALEQTKRFKPDIIFIGISFNDYGYFLDELKKISQKVFAWIAGPIPVNAPIHKLSLILTSSQIYVDNFRKNGINAELLNAAFDISILEQINNVKQDIPISFIGGLSIIHKERVLFLEKLVRKVPIRIWGYGLKMPENKSVFDFFRKNKLHEMYQGEVWGIEMYKIIKRSMITFNMHIAEAENIAGNMRMYESTGLGSMLVSDLKINVNEIFVDGKEAIYYASVDEAIEKITYYLKKEEERRKIAIAGQMRTLKEYNFENNTQKMLRYFEQYLN